MPRLAFFLAFFSSVGILAIRFPPSGMPQLAFFLLIFLPRAYFSFVSRCLVCPGLLISCLILSFFSSTGILLVSFTPSGMPRLAFFLLFLFHGHTFHQFPAVRYAPACFFSYFFSSSGILFISFPPSGMPRLAFSLLFSLLQAYFSSISSRPVCPAAHFQFSIMIKITTRITKNQ